MIKRGRRLFRRWLTIRRAPHEIPLFVSPLRSLPGDSPGSLAGRRTLCTVAASPRAPWILLALPRDRERPGRFGIPVWPVGTTAALEGVCCENVCKNVCENDRLREGKAVQLYVGDLPPTMTEEDVRTLFETFGPVGDVHVVRDHQSGRSLGFGFVQYADAQHARTAIAAFDRAHAGGRALALDVRDVFESAYDAGATGAALLPKP